MRDQILFSHQVSSEEDGQMLQQILQKQFSFSRRMIRKYKQKRLVTVNGRFIYFTARVRRGDRIEIRSEHGHRGSIVPEPIHFSVIYEDQDLVIVDKPPGLVVHPTKGYPNRTLVNGLAYYFSQKNEAVSVHPVNRLDKDTSGLMVVAKHPFAHSFLAREFQKKRVQRSYLAIVSGVVPKNSGTIDAPIGIERGNSMKRKVVENGKPAITHFSICERLHQATLVKLQLKTGRTHQIRVHMASIGHPLIGDRLYGDSSDRSFPRQALHASEIRLFHPREKRWMEWKSFFPEDIMKLYHELRIIN